MKMQKNMRRAGAAVCIAAAVSVSPLWPAAGQISAMAASQISPVTEYSEEELARLRDNVLEYDEIPGLVELYNSEFLSQLDSFYGNPGSSTGLSSSELLRLAGEMRDEAEELSREAENLKDDISKKEYEEYQASVRALKAYAASLEKDAEGKPAAVRSLKQLKNNQVKAARALMREYQTLDSKEQIEKKKLEIAEAEYETALRKKELNMYSAEEVLAAEDARNSARAAAQSAENAALNKKQELLSMLGWRYDANPEIRKVPEADQGKIAGFQPETDSETAILNNYTLMATRRAGAAGLGGQNAKNRQIKSQEDQVRMEMEALYKSVIQKQTEFSAASLEYEAAAADKAAADQKYQMGMLSRQEYLQAEVSWMTAQASKESADLALQAAIEDYEWAVQGLLEIGGQS